MLWKDIQKEEPKDKERVLIWDKHTGEMNIAVWYEEENSSWEFEVGVGEHRTFTHWMLLPEPPIGGFGK